MGGYHPRSLSGKASTPAYPGNNQGLQIAARKGRLFLSQSRRDLLLAGFERVRGIESNARLFDDTGTASVAFVSYLVLFFCCAFLLFFIFILPLTLFLFRALLWQD